MASAPPIPPLDLWAKLSIDFDDARLLLVADGNKIILGIPDQRTLDKLSALGDKAKKPGTPKPAGGPLAALQPLHDAVQRLGLVLDLRVGGKTYAEFGVGTGPRITAAAVLGKIGSFFGGR
ncbi:MAG: hypothetical protein H7330_09405 [Hymenobacteraceae bacterium]|nr:hypothetical protein [Hymenobacteraceae bacterium]